MSRVFRFALLGLMVIPGASCSGDRPAQAPTGPTSVATAATEVTSIRGFVVDTASRPMSGVRVEVLDGVAAGRSALTAGDGVVLLQGIFDKDTRFRASKDGFETWTTTWRCAVATCPGNGAPSVSFNLRPLAAPLQLSGEYSLTISADATCPSLPSRSRSRTYQVAISKRFRENTADLLGYDAVIHDDNVLQPVQRFSIGVAGNYLSIVFRRGEGDVPGLIEQFGGNAYVTYTGSALGTVSQGTTIAMSFDGSIDYIVTASPLTGASNERIVTISRESCSEDNRLLLVRN
jgi:hypothetical protein